MTEKRELINMVVPWQVVAARDVEVKALTEKLKAFASETRRLIEQLRVETVLQIRSMSCFVVQTFVALRQL